MRAVLYVSDGVAPPGRLAAVDIDGLRLVGESGVAVAEGVVEDVRAPLPGLDEAGLAWPGEGGGPTASREQDDAARRFGVLHVAWQLQRTMRWVAGQLGRSLPPLTVRLGEHDSLMRRWGGGHYRLPAVTYSELPEQRQIDPVGEVHLGGGRDVVCDAVGRPYFLAPSHNAGMVLHEFGHHVCRHTADFRLNGLRTASVQTNRRTAVEEGTCDYLAAALLDHPDIYGWHRQRISPHSFRRRRLDIPMTMADFAGGQGTDPHRDGTVWASALWAARRAADQAGHSPQEMDSAVLRGLDVWRSEAAELTEEQRRRRRQFGETLGRILTAAADADCGLAGVIERAVSARGIMVGRSNAQLRDLARSREGGNAA